MRALMHGDAGRSLSVFRTIFKGGAGRPRSAPAMWILQVACLALAASAAVGSPQIFGILRAADEVRGNGTDDDDAKYTLPKDFLLGAGTSAYQVEGAWDADGKGVNVFDYYYHSKNYSVSRTGDVAADHYHRYKEDIALAKKIGLQIFRLSISWARIFPNGTRDLGINKKGVDHYHDVIDELLKNNIVPFVTIFHFDYPQALEDKFGGWLSENMTDAFEDYADYLFEQYGDKVKLWLTINEASMYCNLNGAMGMVPPGTITDNNKRMLCLHNLIIAHAKAHKIYKEKYLKKQQGKVGFGVGPNFSRPNSTADEDVAAAEKANMAYLRELAAGINEDGNKVIGYTLWSFIDTFEFGSYDMGWGLVSVDYKNGTLTRTPKNSWTFFKTVALTRKVPLVEAGSDPFPEPSSAAAATSSLLLATVAVLISRWL
ncbi:Myrosinase 1-like [Frankliniella occidentalis]|nr:Myrosinase 1-like [Frankliniella occidentalis]